MIRDLEDSDVDAVKDIYNTQGFDYAFPSLQHPLFLVKKVREVDGRVVGAMCLRLTAETFLFVEGSPVEKGRSILELQPEVIREAYEKGLADMICVLPPEISEDFGKLMTDRLGWARDRDWPMFSREVSNSQRGESGFGSSDDGG